MGSLFLLGARLGRLTLCFGHTEEGPHAHGHEDGAEEEVGAVAQVRDHVGRGARDDEGAEPGVGRREGDAEHADVQGEDLGGVRPGDALPVPTELAVVCGYTEDGGLTKWRR